MKLIACSSNPELAQKVAQNLSAHLTEVEVKRFADQEIYIKVKENVRGTDVFVLQSTSYPANDHIMELLVCVDALKRASAGRITAVVPYFGYARQDRKSEPRTPISAKLVADIMTKAGVDSVLTFDLHAGQIQGFFDIPVDNLFASPVFFEDIKARYEGKDLVIVSPDVGGLVRARHIAKRLGADLAVVDKRREKAGVSEVMNIIGDVENRHCIIVDDIVDSAGTLCNAAAALIEKGAVSVAGYITHGVLSGPAIERITNSKLTELVITDSIEASAEVKACSKVRVVSIAALLAEAIKRICDENSVSSLLD